LVHDLLVGHDLLAHQSGILLAQGDHFQMANLLDQPLQVDLQMVSNIEHAMEFQEKRLQ
jgi:hypothetical protein